MMYKNIRKATLGDMDRLMEIFDKARSFMRQTGNANQWINGYPQRELIQEEINNGHCFVLQDGQEIIATFCFIKGPDPTYSFIKDGEWPSEKPYYVIHRLASDGSSHNIAQACFTWGLQQTACLRADTHADNKVMQHLLEKNGFTRCGIIYVADGSERIAYQLG